jgi:hypothetical protein
MKTKIPKQWRALKVGERIKKGDRYNDDADLHCEPTYLPLTNLFGVEVTRHIIKMNGPIIRRILVVKG